MLQEHWVRLQPRERRVIVVATAVTAALFAWLFAVEPFYSSLAHKQQRIESLREDVAWMRHAATEAAGLQGMAGGDEAVDRGGRPLLTITEETARTHGISERVRRIQPEGQNAVRVTIEDVAFNDLLRWLDLLVRHHGVRIGGFVVERQAVAGTVNARVTLEEGS